MLRLVRFGDRSPCIAGEDELRPLADAAAAGDARATRTLLTALGPHLLRVVRRVLGSGHPEVEDVTQEVAVEIVRALSRFRGDCSVVHFGCRVALHVAMATRRREFTRKRALPEPIAAFDDEQTASLRPGPEAEVTAQSKAALVRALCDELPAAQAEVLTLHVVLGHTMGEVAVIAAAPLETVRSRLRLAKQALLARALGDPELRELLEETA
ncbi:MAG: sigma-70 family RNA polymerase sigma factor [Polyangiaceae bacterium]|nr:sigma-70 family RNA polymerase sigma factor [Polyangiaceae bacterium]